MVRIEETFPNDLFKGQTIFISGGSSGIGQTVAQGFAHTGAKVIATGSSATKVEKANQENNLENIQYEVLDVRNYEAVKARFASLDELHVLFNCQGVARPESEWTEEEFLNVMDINLNSAMRLSREAFPHLKKTKGSIVNVASMLSYLADADVPSYTASKTGIVGLTRVLAHKYGIDGVRVNAIAPGYHKTNMTKPLWSVEESAEKIANRSALKRWGTTDDLVGPVLFLASPAASFVTGITLAVDGGYHIG
ncbi:MAG: SDR family NAD(P)-dependent oxidoreductase [Alphaproteobacteria bacterium]